ncbi:Stf0 family sulfotransferase [Tateyamaria sp. SN3-11]|uniref:Stf0 family sulfotransferase n=1 Tax=Tateyamaria sp. SN3-11 TaxID=3092147 RepID=UPI0039ED388E
MFATTPRCGSHFVCSNLYQTFRAGLPLEYLNPAHWASWQERAGTTSHWNTLSYLVSRRTSGNGVFSIKMHWSHLSALPTEKLHTWFRGSQWVRIERADVVGQAVSWEIAAQTGSFIYTQPAWQTPKFNFDGIYSKLMQVLEQKEQWRQYFEKNGVSPHVVIHEQFISDPAKETKALIKALGLPRAVGARRPDIPIVESQHSSINSEWSERFVHMLSQRSDENSLEQKSANSALLSGIAR